MKEVTITFKDVFSEEMLSQIYTLFESHLNQEGPFKTTFVEKLLGQVLKGQEYENLQKRMQNLEMDWDSLQIAGFLETHCFMVWFARMKLNGHDFTDAEKRALTAWAFFTDGQGDEEYPHNNVEEQINEFQGDLAKDFIATAFEWNIASLVEGYKDFCTTEGLQL